MIARKVAPAILMAVLAALLCGSLALAQDTI